jgi:hypothetical protein
MKNSVRKATQVFLAASLLIFGASTFNTADAHSAHRGHYHRTNHWVGPFIAGGVVTYALTQPRWVYAQPVYPSPVYTAPPVVLAPPQPLPAQNLPPVWYYCASTQTYYPYVQVCAEGWKLVPATPQ